MNTLLKNKVFFWLSFIVLFIQTSSEAFASHAQSADITYKCLGGNQYQISLSFYRDCAGVNAPTSATVNITSASCGQNLTATLNPISGTGIDITPICNSLTTQCIGGTYPGVQEFIYSGVITLPVQCSDWVFSFSLCCRNASIGTIVNPSSENIYVEARLDNLTVSCNSSPSFSNAPIPFVCIGQPYCFNNGSYDIDGDSLTYTLIAPATSSNTTVTYNTPYSASQPLSSTPLVTFNPATGDMCMSPTQIQVTVFAILVKEWRNGVVIGSVMRDIQLRTINCTNTNPYITGINNTGQYSLTTCAGVPINFNINTYDPDAGQNLTISWNNAITGATFTSTTGARPTATFSWTPTAANISNTSHCFTVTVKDDNCPYNGSQIYSFCINVTGIKLSTTSTGTNCNSSNGTANVLVLSGTGPFTYQWLPNGGNNSTATGLQPGTYTVNVTGAGGCMNTATATIIAGGFPSTVTINSTNVSCYNGKNGTVTANPFGGDFPYTYKWGDGLTTQTITGLGADNYTVVVTTASGCTTSASVTITQPKALSYTTTQNDVSCYGFTDGSATVSVIGGTPPYSYTWNTVPVQTSATAFNLGVGMHSVIVTDTNGCSISTSVTTNQPPMLKSNAMIVSNISCNGLTDGTATNGATGGTAPYSYMWSTTPVQYTQSITGLAPGSYTCTVTDANNCSAGSSITILEPSPLTLSTGAFPVTCNGKCDGQAIVIPTGGTPIYSYQWMPTGGTSPNAGGLCPGTYTIKVIDANGCIAVEMLAVTEPAPIITTATGGTTICSGQNILLTSVAGGGNGNYTYNWNNGITGSTQVVSPTTTTIYSVIATDIKGCSGNIVNVTVNVTSLTAANLTVNGTTSICYGNSTNISSSVTGNTGPVTINWSNGLGSGNGPFTVSPITSTTYTVTATDKCNNNVIKTIPIVVNPLPIINLLPESAGGCGEAVLTFVDHSTTNTGANYFWNFGDGFTSSLISPSHNYTSTGIYNVKLLVTSKDGCKDSATTISNVIIYPNTKAQFVAEAMDGSTVSPLFNFINSSTNATSQIWYFGDGTISTEKNPKHTYPGKGEYLVTLVTTSIDGCKDSISIPVEIKPEFTLYIPSAFTPDGNGRNDSFTAKGQEIDEFSMMIFDRWGELIYQTNDISKGWDGKGNDGATIAQTGIYVYKIEVRDFKNKYHNYVGYVNLLANSHQ